MTNRLDRLEAMGLVERQPDPTDRRGRLVALTDRGRELVDAAVVDHLENEQRLLGALDAGEREQLAGLLRKLLLSPPFRELDPPRIVALVTVRRTVSDDRVIARRPKHMSSHRPPSRTGRQPLTSVTGSTLPLDGRDAIIGGSDAPAGVAHCRSGSEASSRAIA